MKENLQAQCRPGSVPKRFFGTLQRHSKLWKALNADDFNRAGHPSRVSRAYPSFLLAEQGSNPESLKMQTGEAFASPVCTEKRKREREMKKMNPEGRLCPVPYRAYSMPGFP